MNMTAESSLYFRDIRHKDTLTSTAPSTAGATGDESGDASKLRRSTTDASNTSKLHEVLKRLRVFNQMTQSEVAEKLGVSKSQVSEIEAAKRNISAKVVQKYSDIFGINVSLIYLLSEKLENRVVTSSMEKKVLGIFNWITEDDDCQFSK